MAMANDHGPIPVLVVSGFLGSGKTTLLRNLLLDPEAGEIAVIVNEFGEVGIDHHLVRKTDVRTTLLRNGCVCCSMRDDLSEALRHLLSQRERGTIPRFDRVVIETTGLADPAPILHTIVAEPVVRNHFRVERVVTTIDAVNGASNLDSYGEALRQVAAADHVIVTKLDLATPEVTEELKAKLRSINPAATVVDASFGSIDFAPLLVEESHRGEGIDRLREVSLAVSGASGGSRHDRSGDVPVSRLRPPAQLADVRHLVDHVAPSARRPGPPVERSAQRRRGTRSAAGGRCAARHPRTAASAGVAGRGSSQPDRLHRA
jgi:G3E family GTPase